MERELLALCQTERSMALGSDVDTTLSAERTKAWEYYEGGVSNDLPDIEGRSQAVSTDVSQAVHTVLPDLMEIFTGGDDVVAFTPTGEEDEEAAAQETDYINHVFFEQNEGFTVLHDAIQDALIMKTGVFKAWWEDYEERREEQKQGLTADEYAFLAEAVDAGEAEIIDGPYIYQDEYGQPLYDVTIARTEIRGCAKVMAVAPEDWGIERYAPSVRDARYQYHRYRRTEDELIEEGYSRSVVESLPSDSGADDEEEIARDTVNEREGIYESAQRGSRLIEVVEHYVRKDGKLWKVTTAGKETHLLDHEEVDVMPFAVITPYRVAHRVVGRSLADLLMEVQKIKTALTRIMLDHGYYAINQRHEVAMDLADETFTFEDLTNNVPGSPVRVKQPGAVRPIPPAAMGFDVFSALEYMTVEGEQRTGVVRNAQGLNPDTLHDTAKGAEQLMTMAQKRVRFIAKMFAETGIKDLFLLLHGVIQRHSTQAEKVRLRNKWVMIDPTSWGVRKDLTIHIGMGASGKEQEVAGLTHILSLQVQAMERQGGLAGPLVNMRHVYNTLRKMTEKITDSDAELYWSEPPEDEAQMDQPPDPEMVKAQQEAALKREEAQARLRIEQYKAEQKAQQEAVKTRFEMALAEWKSAQELGLEERKMELEARLSALRAQLDGEAKVVSAALSQPNLSDVRPGGAVG